MSFKIPFEKVMSRKEQNERQFYFNSDGKIKVDYDSYGKQIVKRKTASDNVSFFIDNKDLPCQHKNLHSLPYRKGK